MHSCWHFFCNPGASADTSSQVPLNSDSRYIHQITQSNVFVSSLRVISLAPVVHATTHSSVGGDFSFVQIQNVAASPEPSSVHQVPVQISGSCRLSRMETLRKESPKSMEPNSNDRFSRLSRKFGKWTCDVLLLSSSYSTLELIQFMPKIQELQQQGLPG